MSRTVAWLTGLTRTHSSGHCCRFARHSLGQIGCKDSTFLFRTVFKVLCLGILAFLSVVITYFGVNLILGEIHAYN